jgi:hypothetical protein
MLQHVSVYINHQQGASRLYFAKVTMLILVTKDAMRYVSIMAAYLFSPVVCVYTCTTGLSALVGSLKDLI